MCDLAQNSVRLVYFFGHVFEADKMKRDEVQPGAIIAGLLENGSQFFLPGVRSRLGFRTPNAGGADSADEDPREKSIFFSLYPPILHCSMIRY